MAQEKVTEKSLTLDIRGEIDSLSRGPFREALADHLEARPSVDEIREFARKSPDRWSQSVSILAKASGYQDKTVNEKNIYIQIATMPDCEVEARLKQIRAEMEGEVLEGEIVHQPIEDREDGSETEPRD